MRQAARDLTAPIDGFLGGHRVLICDRDSKWSDGFHQMFEEVGIRVVQTPYRAPNCNAHAERFVRSINGLKSVPDPIIRPAQLSDTTGMMRGKLSVRRLGPLMGEGSG
jgi:hypothetical protein